MMDLPLFSQRDSRWSSFLMGSSGYTLGTEGCLDACCAIVLNNYSISVDPGSLNTLLTGIKGYDAGGNLEHEAIPKLWPGKVFWWDEEDTTNVQNPTEIRLLPAEALNRIRRMVSMGIPVPVRVSLHGSPHWVTIVDSSPDDLVMIDPWYGDRSSFKTRYGDPSTAICSFLLLIGEPTSAPDGGRIEEGGCLAQLVEAYSLMSSEEKQGPIGNRLKNAIGILIG